MKIEIISREEFLKKNIDSYCEIYNMKYEKRFLCQMDLNFNNRIFKKLDFLNDNKKEYIYLYYDEKNKNRHSMNSLNVILNYCFMKCYEISFKIVFLVYENDEIKKEIERLYEDMDSINVVIDAFVDRVLSSFNKDILYEQKNTSDKENIDNYLKQALNDGMCSYLGQIEPEPFKELCNMVEENQYKISQFCKIHFLTTDFGRFTFGNLIRSYYNIRKFDEL